MYCKIIFDRRNTRNIYKFIFFNPHVKCTPDCVWLFIFASILRFWALQGEDSDFPTPKLILQVHLVIIQDIQFVYSFICCTGSCIFLCLQCLLYLFFPIMDLIHHKKNFFCKQPEIFCTSTGFARQLSVIQKF